jgi:Domain of unknown function (DUF4062)
MATPKVFVSSTCYDLRYIRENLKFFIRGLGYDPVLSEEGAVFYDPRLHTHDACLAEVPNCQVFVLIIGGRYGSRFKDGDGSVTNAEYREAAKLKIPIFALVEQAVSSDFRVYVSNRSNTRLDATSIAYPSVDDPRIFDFIETVRGNAVNNALQPFRDFSDIESYLRQQWAGMLFAFLTHSNEDARVADTLAMLKEVNERIEMLSRQILKSVGTDEAKLTAALYDKMLSFEAVRDLSFLGCRPTPGSILRHKTFSECAGALGRPLKIVDPDEDEHSISGLGEISRGRYTANSRSYEKLHLELQSILNEHRVSIDSFLAATDGA